MNEQIAQPSQEALDVFERAKNKLFKAGEGGDVDNSVIQDVMSLVALAINKANAPFPRAHSVLSILLEQVGNEKEALKHANIALQQDPNEFRAQFVKIDVSMKGVRIRKLGVGDFIDNDRDIASAIVGSVFKGLFSLGSAAHAATTQMNFKTEILALVEIFNNLCQTSIDANEYIYMSDMLISLGDVLKDAPMPGGKPNLYQEIVNIPLDRIVIGDMKDEVMDIRDKAEGRSLLFKP